MSRRNTFISIALTALMLIASFSALIPIESSPQEDLPHKARISAYTTHTAIFMSGNAGFLGPNASTGISWGSGTASDPYIIQGWEINATGSYGGIHIMNSNVHFVIMNCLIYSADWDGIYLDHVSNGDLIGNDCSKNTYAGIFMFQSGSILIFDNNCSGNYGCGIDSQFSSGNIISDNNCSFNSDYGILFRSSSNSNTVRNNSCINNSLSGMMTDSGCAYNLLFDNRFSGNTEYGLSMFVSIYNRIWNNTFYHNNGAGDAFDPLHVQAYDDGTSNWWNTSGIPHGYGNWWSDWQTPDNNADGIVDNEYNISGSAGSKDSYPLATPPVVPEPPILILIAIIAAIFLIIRRSGR